MKSIGAAVISLVLLSEGQSAWATPPQQSQYQVSRITPRFFLHQSGDLETEEASRGEGWNMVTKAEAVLVLVELNGPQFPIGKGGSLDFTATSGKTRLSHRWQSLEQSYMSESGHITLPFLVYGVACESIKISVVLFAHGKRSTKTEVIPLACGE